MGSLESRQILHNHEDLKYKKMENNNNNNNNDFMAFIRIIKIRKAAVNISGKSSCYQMFK